MPEPFLTIGHSTRSLVEFLDLLGSSGVELIVDVRRLPGSRRYPHFDQDALCRSLAEAGVGYRRAEGLAGRRRVSRTVPFETNAWWQNRSFHNYADHALSDEFAGDLGRLREWGQAQRVALMCSEAVWWRCHRRIIADHLLARNEAVQHILGPGQLSAAQLSPGAVIGSGGVTYSAPA